MKASNKLLLAGAISGATFLGAAGGSMLNMAASAATTTATPAATTATATPAADTANPPAQHDQSRGGHMANGITETVLTGDTATKATAAAQAAVPGGTVLRVENDAEGATYEAHMTKSDGTQVTVKMDANFKVTGTETR